MMDDYDSGMHRTRASRHGMGRFRWLLLFSLAANLFFSYKMWSYKGDILFLETRNDMIHSKLVNVNEEQDKLNQLIFKLGAEKDTCSKLLAESKNALKWCEESKKQHADRFDAASEKLTEALDDAHRLKEEKEEMYLNYSACLSDLSSAQDLAKKLQAHTDAEAEHRVNEVTEHKKEENRVPIAQPLHELEPKIKIENGTTITSEVTADEETAGQNDGDGESVTAVLINCLFNKDMDTQQETCHHFDDFEDTKWEVGHPEFLSNVNDLCLFITGDSSTLQSNSATLVFRPVLSSECLEVSLVFSLIESGEIKVENNGKVFELSKTDDPGWQTEKVHFKQLPPHVIKITGNVPASGGVALAGVTVSQIECSLRNEKDNSLVAMKTNEDKELYENLV